MAPERAVPRERHVTLLAGEPVQPTAVLVRQQMRVLARHVVH